ncbi:MAG: hypothetical protein ABFQ53_02460 [Patescibacteria group bacterium]
MCILTLLATPVYNVSAGYWSENYSANAMKQMMEEVYDEIKKAINSAAKMASIKQATSTIESALYGDSSSPRNIDNFEDFIINAPREKAITYAEDFLTNSLRGTTSGDYTSTSGGSGDALGESIEEAGQNVIDKWSGDSESGTDYQEYCSDTSDIFADGNYQCFSAIMSNPLNTPIGMALATEAVTAAAYEAEQQKADLIAKSTGVLPALDDQGNVMLPSSMVEEIQLQQITLPLKALANGDSNVFASRIQSFAVSLIMDIVERGLGEVAEGASKNLEAIENKYDTEMSEIQNTVGPSMNYSNDSYNTGQKETSEQTTWTNPDTGQSY